MVKQTNKYTTWSAVGLIIGAAFGVLIYSFTMQIWYIAASTGIGLVFGSVIGLRRQKRTDKNNQQNNAR